MNAATHAQGHPPVAGYRKRYPTSLLQDGSAFFKGTNPKPSSGFLIGINGIFVVRMHVCLFVWTLLRNLRNEFM